MVNSLLSSFNAPRMHLKFFLDRFVCLEDCVWFPEVESPGQGWQRAPARTLSRIHGMDQTWDIELPPAPPKSCPGAVSPRLLLLRCRRSSATSTPIGEPARCRCVTMAIGTTEVTKNKCRLCKAQKTVLNPNPDSATFKPRGPWCRVPVQQPPLFAQRGRSPRSPAKLSVGQQPPYCTISAFASVPVCHGALPPRHSGAPWEQVDISPEPSEGCSHQGNLFFFFFPLKPLKTC